MPKLRTSSSDKTQKLKLLQISKNQTMTNSKTQNVTKLKKNCKTKLIYSNENKYQEVKVLQNS